MKSSAAHRHAEVLAATLGDDHDLAVPHDRIAGLVSEGKLLRPDAAWDERLERRRLKLQRHAQRVGSRLYARRH